MGGGEGWGRVRECRVENGDFAVAKGECGAVDSER